jgi:YfiH family protein
MFVPGEVLHERNARIFFGTKSDEALPESFGATKFLKQIHSNKVHLLDDTKTDTSVIEADAIVTTLYDVNLCIKTADCVPIIIYDRANDIIAAIHAGWRGASSGVIQNTIELMHRIGCNLSHTYAFIGPCIRQESYEVSEEVFNAFKSFDKFSDIFFKKYKKDKFFFNLSEYCKYALCESGINIDNITDLLLDTFLHPTLFYSYRYYQREGMELKNNQRQISMIRLEKSLPKNNKVF